MQDEKRWFEFDKTLSESTLTENYRQFIMFIRFYERKYNINAKDGSNRKPCKVKDEQDIIRLIEWCADNFPFQSYKSDVIKDRLWAIIEL